MTEAKLYFTPPPSTPGDAMPRNIISILDVESDLNDILDLAIKLKKKQKEREPHAYLQGRSLAMVFEKPSLRTRISFELAMVQLGGHAMYISPNEIQIGKRESVHDVAKVLSRYADCIMYRAFDHKVMQELGKHTEVPLLNGLDDLEHPCQILADLLTIKEHKGELKGLKLAYIGDGNNVCNSLLLGCAISGMDMSVGCPPDYEPSPEILEKSKNIAKEKGVTITITQDRKEAIKDADVVYTDTWVSMGDEDEKQKRLKAFSSFQVNLQLLSHARQDCIVLHCLPAHRGEEITDEVLDGPNSVVFDEAENRLHAQKAVILTVIRG